MTSQQLTEQLSFSILAELMEGGSHFYFELMETIDDGYDLMKGLAYEYAIIRHVESNTYWRSQVVYEAGEGYTEENNELKWEEVIPKEVVQLKTEYVKKNNVKD